MKWWGYRVDRVMRDRRFVVMYLALFLSLCLIGGLLES